MLVRFILLPVAALLVGLLVNMFHPRPVQWSASGRTFPEHGAAAQVQAENQPDAAASNDPWPRPLPLHEAPGWVRANKAIIIDARTPAAFQAGHVPGAISYPEPRKEALFAEFAKQYAKTKAILVYCDGDPCTLAMDVAFFLQQEGYPNVRVLAEYSSWHDAASAIAEGNAR
ncbi:MAG TPA: rhodanese-like domain-containing protein [Planctomycetota bacterium]|nr:rhodanese-like domain-containing protein [Planctomycetota bacterium]